MRVIGSRRRECLDHVIILNEVHLKRILTDYLEYYHLTLVIAGMSLADRIRLVQLINLAWIDK